MGMLTPILDNQTSHSFPLGRAIAPVTSAYSQSQHSRRFSLERAEPTCDHTSALRLPVTLPGRSWLAASQASRGAARQAGPRTRHDPAGYEESRRFTDVLATPVLASLVSWRHTHSFLCEPATEPVTVTVDTRVAPRLLDDMFADRTRQLREGLDAHRRWRPREAGH